MCKFQLQNYTDEFNNTMGPVGFHVEYEVVDRNPIGLGYRLTMHYKELTLLHTDVLIPPMHIPAEIINNY